MKGAVDIGTFSLILGYLLLLVPVIIFIYARVKLIRKLLISVGRMSVQLLLVGFFLQFIFDLRNPYVTIAWLFVMLLFSSYSVLDNTRLSTRFFFWPVAAGILIANLLVLPFFTGVILSLDSILEPRYAIALGGMLLGNSMRGNIIGLNRFFEGLKRNETRYIYSLSLGATRYEALTPFYRHAMTEAVGPMLATTATMGIVSLPGMMTGQILGGSSPLVAIKYQIAIMLAIFTSMTISTTTAILMAAWRSFDSRAMLKPRIWKKG